MLDRQQTVAAVVLEHPECAQVLHRHHIDFCCRGGLSLEAAAQGRRLDVQGLLTELERAIAERQGSPRVDPRAMPTAELVAHLVTAYHPPLRRGLPFIRTLAAKVSRVHGDHNPRLRELEAAVEDLSVTLLAHLEEAELRTFPALTAPAPLAPALAEPLAILAARQEEATRHLERVRAASEDFTLPDWACRSYRTLFAELEQLERAVFALLHLERHALQPRFAPA